MSIKISVIVIDPKNETITKQYVDLSLLSFYKIMRCKRVDTVYLSSLTPHNSFLYVDDEFLCKDNYYFTIYGQSIGGTAIIVGGMDSEIDESTIMTVDEVKSLVIWKGLQQSKFSDAAPKSPTKVECLDLQWAAFWLGIGIYELKELIAKKEIMAIDCDGLCMIPTTELERYLNKQIY